MVKSESEIRKMTKAQLKQWLTKHDQRLPAIEKLKPYYLERAMKYFNLLQNNKNKKKKKPIISNSRTKKKHNISSITPKKTDSRYNSYSPSLNRSKKRVHKIIRKTPTKQSPSLTRSLKKKRDRMRRATADNFNNNNNNNNNN
eukprot:483904_1